MSVNAMTIKGIITGIGFAPQDGKDGIYYKCYSSHDNYTRSIKSSPHATFRPQV